MEPQAGRGLWDRARQSMPTSATSQQHGWKSPTHAFVVKEAGVQSWSVSTPPTPAPRGSSHREEEPRPGTEAL